MPKARCWRTGRPPAVMRKAGIPISLGVDGCATNDGSNMLDTLRLAYLMQTFLSKSGAVVPPPMRC